MAPRYRSRRWGLVTNRRPELAILGGLVVCFLSLHHAPLTAQDRSMVGELVRVTLADSALAEGVVVRWGAEDLALRTSGDPAWAREWSEVRGVERFSTTRRTLRGLGLGVAIGGLGSALVAAVAVEGCQGTTSFCVGPDSRAEAAMVIGLVGAAAGGVVGLIVGTATTTSSWEPVVTPGRLSDASVKLGVRWRP